MQSLKNCAFFLFICSLASSNSYAKIFTSKSFVVLEKNQMQKTLIIINKADYPLKYATSFILLEMQKDGTFTKKPEQPSISQVVKVEPQELSLNPGEVKTINFIIQNSNLQTDKKEYYGHILFSEIVNESKKFTIQNKYTKSITANIMPVFNLSLPVFIFQGFNQNKIKFQEISFNKETCSISMHITKKSDTTELGKIEINDKQQNTIAKVSNFYILGELKERLLEIKLKKANYETLTIKYTSYKESKPIKFTLKKCNCK